MLKSNEKCYLITLLFTSMTFCLTVQQTTLQLTYYQCNLTYVLTSPYDVTLLKCIHQSYNQTTLLTTASDILTFNQCAKACCGILYGKVGISIQEFLSQCQVLNHQLTQETKEFTSIYLPFAIIISCVFIAIVVGVVIKKMCCKKNINVHDNFELEAKWFQKGKITLEKQTIIWLRNPGEELIAPQKIQVKKLSKNCQMCDKEKATLQLKCKHIYHYQCLVNENAQNVTINHIECNFCKETSQLIRLHCKACWTWYLLIRRSEIKNFGSNFEGLCQECTKNKSEIKDQKNNYMIDDDSINSRYELVSSKHSANSKVDKKSDFQISEIMIQQFNS